MIAFTDPDDHALLVSDMIKQRNELKKKHHMEEICKLARRHYKLRLMTAERRLIKILEEQEKDLKATADNVTAPLNAVKDNENHDRVSKLLKTQDQQRRSISKLTEELKEKNKQVHEAYVKLRALERDYASAKRSCIRRIPAKKLIEMFESRLERALQKMGLIATQNRKSREKIQQFFFFREQMFYDYYKIMRHKLDCQEAISSHLSKAVTSYNNREDFLHKVKVLTEHFKTDMGKVRTNNVLLMRIKEKDSKAEEFECIKNKIRVDCRTEEMESLVKQGLTGIEGELEDAQNIYTRVMNFSGTDNLEELRLQFDRDENENFNTFRYVSSLAEELDSLSSSIKNLRKSIDISKNNLRNEQTENQAQLSAEKESVEKVTTETELSTLKAKECRDELYQCLKYVCDLYKSIVKIPINEQKIKLLKGSVIAVKLLEWMTEIETKISEKLMLIEYLKYLAQEEDIKKPSTINKELQKLSIISSKTIDMHQIKPRAVDSVMEDFAFRSLIATDHFLNTQELSNIAQAIIHGASTYRNMFEQDDEDKLKSETESQNEKESQNEEELQHEEKEDKSKKEGGKRKREKRKTKSP